MAKKRRNKARQAPVYFEGLAFKHVTLSLIDAPDGTTVVTYDGPAGGLTLAEKGRAIRWLRAAMGGGPADEWIAWLGCGGRCELPEEVRAPADG